MNLKYFKTSENWGLNFDIGRGKMPKMLEGAARGVGIITCPVASTSGIQSGSLRGSLAFLNGIVVSSLFNSTPNAHAVEKFTPATVSQDMSASAISA